MIPVRTTGVVLYGSSFFVCASASGNPEAENLLTTEVEEKIEAEKTLQDVQLKLGAVELQIQGLRSYLNKVGSAGGLATADDAQWVWLHEWTYGGSPGTPFPDSDRSIISKALIEANQAEIETSVGMVRRTKDATGKTSIFTLNKWKTDAEGDITGEEEDEVIEVRQGDVEKTRKRIGAAGYHWRWQRRWTIMTSLAGMLAGVCQSMFIITGTGPDEEAETGTDENRLSAGWGLLCLGLWIGQCAMVLHVWKYFRALDLEEGEKLTLCGGRACKNACVVFSFLMLSSAIATGLLGMAVFSNASFALLFAPAVSAVILSFGLLWFHRQKERVARLGGEAVNGNLSIDEDKMQFLDSYWNFLTAPFTKGTPEWIKNKLGSKLGSK